MRYIIIYIVFLYSNSIFCQQEYAWVYFKDKKNVEYFINNPELILTELSISKKQSKGIPIDYKDVPINTNYFETNDSIDNLSILT